MPGASDDPIRQSIAVVEQNRAAQISGRRQGDISLFTCPDCSGTLWQVNESDMIQFRCHVGHTVSAEGLLQAQSEAGENALWRAVRTFTDMSILARQMAAKARSRNEDAMAALFEQQAHLAEKQARAVRQIIENAEIITS